MTSDRTMPTENEVIQVLAKAFGHWIAHYPDVDKIEVRCMSEDEDRHSQLDADRLAIANTRL
jgi:hypothetical protein